MMAHKQLALLMRRRFLQQSSSATKIIKSEIEGPIRVKISIPARKSYSDNRRRSSSSIFIKKSKINDPFGSSCRIDLHGGSIIGSHDEDDKALIFVFDVGTSGLSRRRDRITEIAIQDLNGGQNSTFQTLLNPADPAPAVGDHHDGHDHHIGSGIIDNYKVNWRHDIPRWKDVEPNLLSYVRSRKKFEADDSPVLFVAHNARCFDVPFLMKEFNQCSMQIPCDWLFLDTLPLARQLLKSDGSKRLSSVSLQALRDHYNIPLIGKEHRAMSDVHVLSLVLQQLTHDLHLPVSALLHKSFKASDLKIN